MFSSSWLCDFISLHPCACIFAFISIDSLNSISIQSCSFVLPAICAHVHLLLTRLVLFSRCCHSINSIKCVSWSFWITSLVLSLSLCSESFHLFLFVIQDLIWWGKSLLYALLPFPPNRNLFNFLLIEFEHKMLIKLTAPAPPHCVIRRHKRNGLCLGTGFLDLFRYLASTFDFSKDVCWCLPWEIFCPEINCWRPLVVVFKTSFRCSTTNSSVSRVVLSSYRTESALVLDVCWPEQTVICLSECRRKIELGFVWSVCVLSKQRNTWKVAFSWSE